jgi:hypothetical protein
MCEKQLSRLAFVDEAFFLEISSRFFRRRKPREMSSERQIPVFDLEARAEVSP